MESRTRAQQQAEAVLARIEALCAGPDKTLRAEYKARADSFPVMVMQAGLAQAIGFMQAKRPSKPAYGRYLDDLANVLGAADGRALQEQAITASLPDYRLLTRNTLAVAGWFKRFGQAYLTEAQTEKTP